MCTYSKKTTRTINEIIAVTLLIKFIEKFTKLHDKKKSSAWKPCIKMWLIHYNKIIEVFN